MGILASLGLIGYDLPRVTLKAPLQDGAVVGAFGLWVACAHLPLTSFLGAYLILWWFVFWLYIRTLPRVAQTLIPGTIGVAGLLWARRRFAALGATDSLAAEQSRQVVTGVP